ncbi:unnamed protein product [Effrenium voratum]|nr:unnamed protein product [Effrenium voratum]
MDAFSVTVGQLDVANQNVSDMAQLAQPTLPTAASIFAVVAAMEVARRTAASKYGVELTPPVFVPVWPLPSLGCFGAISRQQSIVPNEEANLAMSISAGLAGYATSILLVLIGLAVGPGEEIR